MGRMLPPTPDDARFTAAVMPLLDLEVLLHMDHSAARTWTRGSGRTVLGATVVLRDPVVPTIETLGMDVDLPLVSVAGLALLHTVHDRGTGAEALADIVCELDVEAGGPVLAHESVAHLLPAALVAAAEVDDDPSLLRPLSEGPQGWRLHPEVQRVLGRRSYDADGWVTEVVLADLDVIQVVATAGGRVARSPSGELHGDAAVELFRHGYTLDGVAAALDCSSAQVEEALRQRI